MNRSLVWRGVLIAALAALAVWRAWPPRENVNLGLDLQGGIHLVLRVETQDAVRAETDKDMEILRREAEQGGIVGVRTVRVADDRFDVAGSAADRLPDLEKIARDWLGGGWSWRRDGETLRFEMRAANESAIRDGAVNQALQTIRNRVDQFGVSEPLIVRQGLDSERIVVQLPGVDDPERVKRLIKHTHSSSSASRSTPGAVAERRAARRSSRTSAAASPKVSRSCRRRNATA
jgi:preprotein translocase subunit SecD